LRFLDKRPQVGIHLPQIGILTPPLIIKSMGIVNLIGRQITPGNLLSKSSLNAIRTAPNNTFHVN
jgi:hypothetical protein